MDDLDAAAQHERQSKDASERQTFVARAGYVTNFSALLAIAGLAYLAVRQAIRGQLVFAQVAGGVFAFVALMGGVLWNNQQNSNRGVVVADVAVKLGVAFAMLVQVGVLALYVFDVLTNAELGAAAGAAALLLMWGLTYVQLLAENRAFILLIAAGIASSITLVVMYLLDTASVAASSGDHMMM